MRKIEKMVESIEDIVLIAGAAIAIIPAFLKVFGEGIVKAIITSKKKRKILKNLKGELSEKDKEFLLEDMECYMDRFFMADDYYEPVCQSLYYRLNKTKNRLEQGELTSIDYQLIHYLYEKEKLENIPYKVEGSMRFELGEPYLSFLKLRIKNHFFLKHYVDISKNNELVIRDWQREKTDLLDVIVFIHKYGKVESMDLTFPYDEYGFDRISVECGKLVGLIKGEAVTKIEYSAGYLMGMEINTEEKRRMKINEEFTVPLVSEYMKQEYDWKKGRFIADKEDVLLENGNWVSACTQCVFRTRQISNGGCRECVPKKINKPIIKIMV